MARQITNDLTWSVSRARLFRSCQRAYYYAYYGAWGGWSAEAPERAQLLYRLKQMVTFPLWGGKIVHDVIRDALTNRMMANKPFTVNDLQQAARARLRAGWIESRDRKWEQDPKRATNLFEHYYGEGREIPREQTDALKEAIYSALENFATCDTVRELLELPSRQWAELDKLDSFVGGELPADDRAPAAPLKAWCAVDLGYFDHGGVLHIVDWKTGTEHKEELRLQLACYALYAMKKYQLPLEKISLGGVLLNDGGRLSTYAIPQESLVNATDQMLKSACAMRGKLQDVAANIANEDDFEFSHVPSFCANCQYRKVCPNVGGAT
ncbi:MAG: PD-(D/E)XK nuclease family protein [Victivallales bacterium]|nr:PD-(D/E)XK nuclease family protein [Victivallales bacterium]